jgi:flap endonuclease-1
MYRALSAKTAPIKVIASQIVAFRQLGINMIYVFDGPPPIEKEQTAETRRDSRKNAAAQIEQLRVKLNELSCDSSDYETVANEINRLEISYPQLTYEMKDEIKSLLDIAGIRYINAKHEADSVLAHLYRREQIQAVASFDLDFLARGVRLITPRNVLDEPGFPWTLIVPEEIYRALGLSEQKFVDLCVLMGSDYTPNLPIVPWSIALQSLRQGMSVERIWSRHTFSNWRRSPCGIAKQTVDELELFKRARMILSGQGEPDDSISEMNLSQHTNISADRLRSLYPDLGEQMTLICA